jgi:GGDEF domain-containing protein
MHAAPKAQASDLERRETQLTLFACAAIAILGGGTAILMYPLVFSQPDKTLRVAFVGFCTLCLLLAGYLWERQSTVRRLRQEMAEERTRVALAQQQASVELLKTMPNFASFQDRLPMEFRRTTATTQKLSILVASVLPPKGPSGAIDPATSTALFGDAAKVISRKLREQDSIYILAEGCFGVVLPGADAAFARGVHDRVADGLADAAGVSNRFTYKIKIVNFPDDAKSATELAQAVSALMSSGNSMRDMAQALHSTAV